MKSILIKIIAAIIVVVILVSLFNSKSDLVQPQKLNYASLVAAPTQTLLVEKTPVFDYASVNGYFVAKTSVQLAPRVSATITDVAVNVGDKVSTGDVLLSIDARDAESTLLQARAAVAAAQTASDLSAKDLSRTESLMMQQAATQQQFDQIITLHQGNMAQAQIARHQLEQAQTNLGYYQIVSPIDGVVHGRLADAGDLAMPGKTILLLDSEESIEFKGALRESLGASLQVNDEISIDTVNGRHLARIISVSPNVNLQVHSFEITALVNDDKNLRPGMRGDFAVAVNQRQALLVPSSALRTIGQLKSLKVKVGDAWRWRNVRTREQLNGQVEIVAGIKPGDLIGLDNE
ncbi:MAG: HlyD family secretion protein [Myxococcota bacterium]|jgi:HlyD family secretion protein